MDACPQTMIAMNAMNAKAAAAANHDNTLLVTASARAIDFDLLLKRMTCTLCERCTPAKEEDMLFIFYFLE
jgi:ferredoxin